MSSVLSITDLIVRFGGGAAAAVGGVSLELQRGEIFGLVGESGCGKSTLASAVMGLLPASASVSGSVRVNGREVVGLGDAELRSMRGAEVAMIFQDASASLDPTWSVGDQIAETIRAHRLGAREAKARALALMTRLVSRILRARYMIRRIVCPAGSASASSSPPRSPTTLPS